MYKEEIRKEDNFLLPQMNLSEGEGGFSADELGADVDGMSLGFQRIKIPAGGALQFEIPSGDPENPDYEKTIVGVVMHHHEAYSYWAEGEEYSENARPLCASVDGKDGFGSPGGKCKVCALNRYGTAQRGTGKACKNMRILYVLRSGDTMPMQLNLPPTSLKPWKNFVNQAFLFRRRASWGSVIEIGLKKMTNGKDAYSVATFRLLRDFCGEELTQIRTLTSQFHEQLELILAERVRNMQQMDDENEYIDEEDWKEGTENFEIDGDSEELPA